jgi:hypothetical protein
MKIVKFFEDFKVNNITQEDIINCIKKGGSIYSSVVKELPDNDPKKPLSPKDISEDGEITIDLDGKMYYVDLDDVERVETEVVKESKKISILHDDFKNHVPKTMQIVTSNGEFKLELTDCHINFPKIEIAYHHWTPDKTGDVLSDGEPDYLCFDLNFHRRDKDFQINVENTYGDAMMFEFKISPPNTIEVGHYNGYNSKYDPKYVFSYTEDSINDLMEFFNKFTFGLKLTRDKFNFLDIDPNSYKFEKVGHKIITNFRNFN